MQVHHLRGMVDQAGHSADPGGELQDSQAPIEQGERTVPHGKASRELGHSLGRAPSAEEIAGKLDVPRKNIEGMLSIHSTHLSLDRPVYDGSDKTFQEMMASDGEGAPEDAVAEDSLKSSVMKCSLRWT